MLLICSKIFTGSLVQMISRSSGLALQVLVDICCFCALASIHLLWIAVPQSPPGESTLPYLLIHVVWVGLTQLPTPDMGTYPKSKPIRASCFPLRD